MFQMAEQEKEVVEKGNDIITIYKGGQAKDVTRKAFKIHYAGKGYTLDEDSNKVIEYTVEYLQGLNYDELQGVTNTKFKEAFDKAGIAYEKKANKDELIKLIPKKSND